MDHRDVQLRLLAAHLYERKVDSGLGDLTKAAVKAFCCSRGSRALTYGRPRAGCSRPSSSSAASTGMKVCGMTAATTLAVGLQPSPQRLKPNTPLTEPAQDGPLDKS
jgi:hypothetical protein